MKLGIYGSGGAGRGTKEIADLQNCWDEIVFIDDTVSPDIYKGIPRMPFETFKQVYPCSDIKIVIALGEPEYKIALYNKVKNAGYQFANVIHPRAQISPTAKLGTGLIIQIGAVVSCDTVIGDNVTLMQYSVVTHDVIVSNHVQISAFVMIAGHCVIGEGTYIGIGVPVKEYTKIGNNSVIGMGSVVSRDIPDNVIALGNPARAMQARNSERVFK